MKNIIVLGECMVEFGPTNETNHYKKSFAGDVFNTAIYIKRCMNELANVQFLTAVGDDAISFELLSMMERESLDTGLVYQSPIDKMGLYLINVDNNGERSFTYWRDTSAAKQVIKHLYDDGGSKRLNQPDIFFFSGISIAILSEVDREKLWLCIAELKKMGTQIIFDPNYRPTLWHSIEQTQDAYAQAFNLADIALPGVDDLIEIYGINNVEAVADFLEQFSIDEIVIKNGAENLLICQNGQRETINITPVKYVVDTTSAGDGFNGGYVSAKLLNKTAKQAAEFAAQVSACVIQHKGAIVEKTAFNKHLVNHPL